MSWLFSRALVVEYSGVRFSDIVSSAQSSETPTPQAFWCGDKTTEHSRLSRFGMTCVPLTENHGAALLTWFQEGFLARTSVLPETAQDLTASALDSGEKWRGSLAKYDPVSHSLKTAQLSFLEDLTGCLLTLPRSGWMRDGECFPLPMLAQGTSGKEFGFWPTPNVIGFRSDGELAILARNLTDRSEFVAMSDRACKSKRERFFPTATATAYKGWSANHNRANTDDRIDYTIEREAHYSGLTGRLNPDWLEWLMGWPIGHTALKPLEMGKFQEWRRQHGDCLEANE